MFVMNLMLGAHARGLGTCAQGAISIYDDIVRSEFDVPEGYELLYGVALGYPSDSQANTFAAPRFKPEDITVPLKS
jgi:nitroreductase